MKNNTKWVAALAVVALATATLNGLYAQEPAPAGTQSVIVDTPAQPVETQQVEPQPVVVQSASIAELAATTSCAPKYCIKYHKHRRLRRVCCDDCLQPYTAMLNVTDPCTCIPVEVPVCVPGCCTDAPKMSCRRGLFGRTVTEFTWCCGYRVKIVLSSRRNEITVHTYGS